MTGAVRARRAAALALVVLGLCLYARTLDYEFLDWDDTAQVVENPWIRSLSLEHLAAIFSRPVVDSYFPLQSISFMLDYALWGLDPRGYHLQSVLWNALNGALAFWVLAQLTRLPALAFLAALFWSVHHSHVESVAWVSARKEVLATALLLLSLGSYLRARCEAALDRRFYAASIALFGLGAAAKLTIAPYALFFVFADWTLDARLAPEQRRPLLHHLVNKVPYAAVALPFVLMNLWVQPVADAARASGGFDYLLVRGQAAWRYLLLLVGALPGQPLYDPPPISRDPWLAAATLLPLVASPAAFAFALRRGYPNAALALAWLIIGMIAPLAFPLTTFMADRYLYSPSLGFCWLLAAGVASMAFVPGRSRAWNASVALLLTVPPLVWFAERTWSYTPVWQNSETFWTRAVATSRDGRAVTALSAALIRQARLEEAEKVLTEATALGANGYLHLAIVYLEQNRIDDALGATDQAIARARVSPPPPADAAKLMWIRGVILAKLGRLDDAGEAWKAALIFDPEQAEARAALDGLGGEGGAAIQPAP